MTATLIANGLAKSYKKRLVVKNVSLTVAAGQIVGLLGPNGAGKTTSFYMIVGLVPNDSGSIILNGEDVTLAPMHVRARKGIGYLPQEASIFRKLTVSDNIMAILQTRKELSEVDREEKLANLLEEFHIGHIKDNLGMSLYHPIEEAENIFSFKLFRLGRPVPLSDVVPMLLRSH